MYVRKKQKVEKEVPAWKRALEEEADEGAPSHSEESERPPASTDGCTGQDDATAGSGPSEAKQPAAVDGEAKPPAVVDGEEEEEDDEEDDFDPSIYDVAAEDESAADAASSGPAAGGGDGDDGGGGSGLGVLYAAPHTNAGMCAKRQFYQDSDNRDALCMHPRGASESDVQALVSKLPGYKATRFVNNGMVFVLFADSAFAHEALAAMQGAALTGKDGRKQTIRVEWAKRSLRPH